jgi:hypothetical protein
MFDEHEESPPEHARTPAEQAREKGDEFRMHAELFAVFEGCRKFDSQIRPTLSADLAREIQQAMGQLEKSRSADHPILPPESTSRATALLTFPDTHDLATNDYHVYRRPGEVMIVRWLAADLVDAFYERLQAHFDAALEGYREDERHARAWKQDVKANAFLDALDKIEIRMAERYLREPIRAKGLFVLSTHAADELNIAYLADYVMGVAPAEIVGETSAPPADGATEQDLAWFFKLFSLRGTVDGAERMCFFTYLQKSDDTGW